MSPKPHRKTPKLTNRRRVELRDRWRDEIFPAMLLIVGPPPRKWRGEPFHSRDTTEAYRAWSQKVIVLYRVEYVGIPDACTKTDTHVIAFAEAFARWCREERYDVDRKN